MQKPKITELWNVSLEVIRMAAR